MGIRSPLSNLAEVIGEIRRAAQEYGRKLMTAPYSAVTPLREEQVPAVRRLVAA